MEYHLQTTVDTVIPNEAKRSIPSQCYCPHLAFFSPAFSQSRDAQLATHSRIFWGSAQNSRKLIRGSSRRRPRPRPRPRLPLPLPRLPRLATNARPCFTVHNGATMSSQITHAVSRVPAPSSGLLLFFQSSSTSFEPQSCAKNSASRTKQLGRLDSTYLIRI